MFTQRIELKIQLVDLMFWMKSDWGSNTVDQKDRVRER